METNNDDVKQIEEQKKHAGARERERGRQKNLFNDSNVIFVTNFCLRTGSQASQTSHNFTHYCATQFYVLIISNVSDFESVH